MIAKVRWKLNANPLADAARTSGFPLSLSPARHGPPTLTAEFESCDGCCVTQLSELGWFFIWVHENGRHQVRDLPPDVHRYPPSPRTQLAIQRLIFRC